MDMPTANEVLSFWYEDLKPNSQAEELARVSEKWFVKDEAFDEKIREHFAEALAAAKTGELDHWAQTPRGRLALVILLDQFSRNLFRDSPEAFAADPKALHLTLEALAQGTDAQLEFFERIFLYMPLMHAEDLAIQEQSVQTFGRLLYEAQEANSPYVEYLKANRMFAQKHRDIIAEFGHFPHRNATLGRPSTPEELVFLQDPKNSF